MLLTVRDMLVNILICPLKWFSCLYTPDHRATATSVHALPAAVKKRGEEDEAPDVASAFC